MMHILIVDDAADMRRSLQLLLHQVGYTDVSLADSGAAALEFLAKNQESRTSGRQSGVKDWAADSRSPAPDSRFPTPVDVILLDVMMPQLNGIEACRRIKAHPEWRDIPIIMVTALTDEQHLSRAFDAGAMDYLTKPVRFAELIARLRSALALKQELDIRRLRERELLHVTEQLANANASLQRLATLDSLTGLANRRALDEHLEREWRRCSRAEIWLSVLMADVDLFKPYNDHYGHQSGDECLQRIGTVMQAAVRRAGDLAARFGGEEFLLVLPGADAAGLAGLAERLRRQVELLAMTHAASSVAPHVTISLGGASALPRLGGAPEQLVALADTALYEAKNAGRNQSRISRGRQISEMALAHEGNGRHRQRLCHAFAQELETRNPNLEANPKPAQENPKQD